jgi:hypothetical protein
LNNTSHIISFYGSFNSLNEIKQESKSKQKILLVLNDDLKRLYDAFMNFLILNDALMRFLVLSNT